MTTKNKKLGNLILIILCAALTAAATCLIVKEVLSDELYHNMHYVEFEHVNKKNSASIDKQIRICNLSNQNGYMWNLQSIAEEFEWTYDAGLESLAYYGTGEEIVHVDLEETSKLFISFLEQPSSGMINIYVDGDLYGTYDLYSPQWKIETVEIKGKLNTPRIIGLFTGIFCLLFLFVYVYMLLLKDWNGCVRSKSCVAFCWIIIGLMIILVCGFHMYPQLEWKFTDGEYQDAELHDFVRTNESLHSTSGNPYIKLQLNGRRVLVQSVSIFGVEEITGSEWAHVFLITNDYLGQEFFIENGKNVVHFPMRLYSRDKVSAVRLDLVSRADVDIRVSEVILNERGELAFRLLTKYILIVTPLLLVIGICQLVYRRKQKGLATVFLMINPLVIFLAVNSLSGQVFSMKLSIWIWTYIMLVLWQIVFFALTNRPLVGMGIVQGIWLILAVINYYVTESRGMPLTFNDIYNAKTALTVVEKYTYELTPNIIISVAGCIGFWLLTFLLLKTLSKKKPVNQILQFPKNQKGYFVRIAAMISAIALMVLIIHFGGYGGHLGTLNVTSTYMNNGFILGILSSNSKIKKPNGYRIDKAEEILDKYKVIGGWQNADIFPNIIMIMNESFADLSMIHDFKTNIEVLPVYNNLVDNVVKGKCFVSVVGGGTSNTEFEALTGNTMAFFPAGTNAYTQYCSEEFPSLVSYLKKLNYECIALHPNVAINYNRNNVYRYMGFDDFLSIDSFEGAEEVRYISDRATYKKIIELFENRNKEIPLFIFDLTMQNHGGYGTSYNWEEPVSILNYDYKKSNEYLSSIHVSDQALGELIEYFKKVDEPTIILFFGDHQPAIEDDFISDLLEFEEEDEFIYRYMTPYVIWANYQIDTQLELDLSANYLATKLLETAGIPGTEKDMFLACLYRQLPIITSNGYMDSAGIWYNWNEQTEYQQILEEYQLLQYAFFSDKSEKAKELFGR